MYMLIDNISYVTGGVVIVFVLDNKITKQIFIIKCLFYSFNIINNVNVMLDQCLHIY